MPAAEVADVLLTPSESNALSSFLSVVDRLDPNTPQFLSPEWNMYAATLSNQVHLQEGKEDLARATKDLISSGFGAGESAGSLHAVAPHLYNPSQNRGAQFGPSTRKLSSAAVADGTQLPHSFLQNARSWPSVPQASSKTHNAITIKDTTYNPYGMAPPQSLSLSGPGGSFPSSRPSLSAISTSLPSSSASGPSSGTPTTARPPLSSASSLSGRASRKRPSLDVQHPASAPAGVSLESNKRSRPSPPGLAGSSGAHRSSSVASRESGSTSPQVTRSGISRASFSNTTANGKSLSASRRNTTTTSPKSSSSSDPTPPPEASASSSTSGPPKQQLLSAEQKKLNHIHSEQKRRANIRRGYDALCDVVPALREAIRAEEAECMNTGKKRGRGKLLGEDGEKMDGRAGPRSESVVLQKTIEHIDDLMAQRSSYLERLRAAKAALPPGHPALLGTSQGEQPWEKIWNGGVGLPLGGEMDADGDPMDQDGDDDDGGSEEEEGSRSSSKSEDEDSAIEGPSPRKKRRIERKERFRSATTSTGLSERPTWHRKRETAAEALGKAAKDADGDLLNKQNALRLARFYFRNVRSHKGKPQRLGFTEESITDDILIELKETLELWLEGFIRSLVLLLESDRTLLEDDTRSVMARDIKSLLAARRQPRNKKQFFSDLPRRLDLPDQLDHEVTPEPDEISEGDPGSSTFSSDHEGDDALLPNSAHIWHPAVIKSLERPPRRLSPSRTETTDEEDDHDQTSGSETEDLLGDVDEQLLQSAALNQREVYDLQRRYFGTSPEATPGELGNTRTNSARYSAEQRAILEEAFAVTAFPDRLEPIAERCGLSRNQVKEWFKYQRRKRGIHRYEFGSRSQERLKWDNNDSGNDTDQDPSADGRGGRARLRRRAKDVVQAYF
ncbi:hypothetical protein FS837_007083 [Tulasnella sp. UAMH 9824]|nr:hypothetical protein FS837_007083 [Tulasnella sp. UAMH 9824]